MMLKLNHWQTVGILESIWLMAQEDATDGAIGKYSNSDIAAAIEYEGNPDEMIQSLIESGWLDNDEEFRLIIHDWSDHVPKYIKGGFSKAGKLFADQIAKQRANSSQLKLPANSSKLIDTSYPNLTKPNQTKPNQNISSQNHDDDTFDDPFKDYPKLKEFYGRFLYMLKTKHPTLDTIPKPETPKSIKWQTEFANLVRLDGFSEDDVVNTLTWCLTREEESDSGFSWFQQVQSAPGLRNRKGGKSENPRKFAQIHAAYGRDNGDPGRVNDRYNFTPEQKKEMIEKYGWMGD